MSITEFEYKYKWRVLLDRANENFVIELGVGEKTSRISKFEDMRTFTQTDTEYPITQYNH